MSDLANSPAFAASDMESFQPGMTYREWLVGMAIQGLLSQGAANHDWTAEHAINYADAVIARLEAD